MAECHPVGFQWVMEAKARGAKLIHVDPRFTRTTAVADLHVPLRAGADIAFVGGLINYVLQNDKYFRDYVVAYTNAPVILTEDFADTEDLDGVFSGLDREHRVYDSQTWRYQGDEEMRPASGQRGVGRSLREVRRAARGEAHGSGGAPAHPEPDTDESLQHPRCVFQVLKRHFARYTPELVAEVCGVPEELFAQVARLITENSGRDRTTAFVYSLGWTQHTVGVQYIRTAAILQALLGNMGRPGGGILALRGHASIQGSTDIPTLFDLLPGYLPMPHAHSDDDLDSYVEAERIDKGFWANTRDYMVSLMKAWWGDAATADNDFCYDYLPRLTGSHSTYETVLAQMEGVCKGYFLFGQNPAVGSANARMQRLGMASLDWLVVRDLVMIESATWWKNGPEIETGEMRTEDIGTEVFFMPAAAHTEKSGSFTNTQRMLQWHHTAVEPAGDARSDLWFTYHLGRRIREKLAAAAAGPSSGAGAADAAGAEAAEATGTAEATGAAEAAGGAADDQRDRPVLDLTWDYPTEGPLEEPDAEAVLAEINGWDADGKPLSSFGQLADDGSTACGCWIYCGVRANGVNQADRRTPGKEQSWVAPEWGWAWPANRRTLYNRASADPDGNPWSERKAFVWWDVEAGKWTGHDVPDFPADTAPSYRPEPGTGGPKGLAGDDAFIMQADGKAWLYAPAGLLDGPMPSHYEPQESPVSNPFYRQQANPTRQVYKREDNLQNPSGSEPGSSVYPYVFTTYRLTEHHTAGGMSRWLPYLSELQPEFFCEVSPALARDRGLVNLGWATIISARTAIEARVLVTDRVVPLVVAGRTVHQIGLPYHWGVGSSAIVSGDSANDLFGVTLDPNVHIQESKVGSCDIQPGRRPTGPALLRYVAAYRSRAGITVETGNQQRTPRAAAPSRSNNSGAEPEETH
jgi:formate dehydrogenase major subunit